jgi:hypothetical protein
MSAIVPPDDSEGELPPPVIETVRNRGALLSLGGAGVRGHATELRNLAPVLEHFDRLVRVVQVIRSGLSVERIGRLVEVSDAARLVALPAMPGSYEIPLALVSASEQMSLTDATDVAELEEVADLLALQDGHQIAERLRAKPERLGDELLALLYAVSKGSVDIKLSVFSKGSTIKTAYINASDAKARRDAVREVEKSEPGTETVTGELFRIDTRSKQIAVLVPDPDDAEESSIVQARFEIDQLETLRSALRKTVEVGLEIVDERRLYERAPHKRSVTVRTLEVVDPPSDPEI